MIDEKPRAVQATRRFFAFRTSRWTWRRSLALMLALSVLSAAVGGAGGYLYGQTQTAVTADRMWASLTGLWSDTGQIGRTADFAVLEDAIAVLEDEFIGELPGDDVLNQAAIEGVLAHLDDRYTLLLRPEQAALEASDTSGQFGGIGSMVEWSEEDLAVRITEPFPGSPAAEAGLVTGDLVIAVDGEPVAELGMSGTISRVRGPVDTEVRLDIRRGAEEFELTITRATIDMPTTSHELIGPDANIGYVRLHTFNALAADKLGDVIKGFESADVTGLILDLRGNGGGLLDESVEVAGLLAGRGLVVRQIYSDGREEEHRAQHRAVLARDTPLVVLVNRSSASASELVAGALQDNGRAILIGEPTLGKGSVQVTRMLADESQIRVTNSLWFTPKGRSINGEGLVPDVLIERMEQGAAPEAADSDEDADPYIEAALRHLAGLRTGS
ncbi:MAG: S41 family peptidase [Caldilineaceae bacterium SB0662_bin_9]|uniref:S41 family peptidase n=1 Tax=Caldilineaceae bacterium SB0662_bin_9 TaxID=2605258 RepID=A0A6B1DX88_9CHLR|nr:S41 family peptidase [Caldilineaceae bacterium SB0662_bin_9]